MIFFKKHNLKKNKRGSTLVEMVMVILISMIILSLGYNAGYKYLQRVGKQHMTENIRTKINDTITANYTGRGIDKKRIKRNALIFRNGADYIDNYYYTEVYKVDPITMFKSPLPTIEFLGMERVKFPKGVRFEFPEVIEGTTLPVIPYENTRRLAVIRTVPDNELKVFNGDDTNFQIIPNDDLQLLQKRQLFLKGDKKLYIGKPLEDDVTYYAEVKGSMPVSFVNSQIDVYYNFEKIGRIVINTQNRMFKYIPFTDEVKNIVN